MEEKIIERAVNQFGTPIYLYSMNTIIEKIAILKNCLFTKSKLYYSVKANPLIAICQIVKNYGCGVEVSSIGELIIVTNAGILPKDIIFTGPGKTKEEIAFAVKNKIKLINIESIYEAGLINRQATKEGYVMPVSLRLNPANVQNHAKIKMSGISSQFGIDEELLNNEFFEEISSMENIDLKGIQVYMGTQILKAEEILHNTEYIIKTALKLSKAYGFKLEYLNLGGGFGIPYFKNEESLNLPTLKQGMTELEKKYGSKLARTEIIFESGRFLMADAGIYAVKVLYIKESKGSSYLVCDGGSNFHSSSAFLGRYIRNNFPMYILNNKNDKITKEYHVTGPLCTPTDLLGQKVKLGQASIGDIIVIEKSGAYGLTHSPVRFLSKEMPLEVLYYENEFYVLRESEPVGQVLKFQNPLSEECKPYG